MKILGEANCRALAKNDLIIQVLLRGDPKKFLKSYIKNFLSKFFYLLTIPFNSNLNLTINSNELIKKNFLIKGEENEYKTS